ncbi:MAG TPA: membrane protein insertase YidC [Acidobacteriaceae bacterium]|nr:membrane protein insertase YidC [Acidobacteriaceae bacterium]
MAEIKNPNQQGGGQDSKTILIFTAVFLVILFGMQFYREKISPPPKPQEHAQQETKTQPATAPAQQTPAPAANTAVKQTVTAPQVSDVVAKTETTTVVENELYRITFTNRGAQVKSWILKKYKDNQGKPLDLVNQTAAEKYGYPLSLYTYDAGLRSQLANALYVPSTTGDINAPAKLTFEYSSGGIIVRKTFSFDSSYVIHAKVTVTDNGAPVQAMLAWPAGFGDQTTLPDYANGSNVIDTAQNDKVDRTAMKKVSGGGTLHGPFDWAGVSDLYFAAIFLPDNPDNATLVTLRNSLDVPKDFQHPVTGGKEETSVLGAAIGDTNGPLNVRLFAGPKAIDVLESIHAVNGGSLEKAVDFGWFSLVAKPLFFAMRFIYDHVIANWGWAILLLTLVINLAMTPTRFQMMKSSVKMQRIQPQMDAIKAKYAKYKATDPRKQDMQKEMFDLQKSEGVNMFGGCLPMLISYPLLFGFYKVLENVIDLRQAHWLWIHDLSAPDPLYLLPIFMIVSMAFSTLMTPAPGMDPTQRKMMAFVMPGVFGFMMIHYGAGLSLYWAGSNVIGIGQQLIINRTKMGREMRELALKRAAKKKSNVVHARR